MGKVSYEGEHWRTFGGAGFGALLGFILSGFNPIGAAVGGFIGGLIGGTLDRVEMERKREKIAYESLENLQNKVR